MNRVCSIFSQLLQLFPRTEFAQAVKHHKAERHARGFDCWTQFIAMLFCQLGRAQSLREICGGAVVMMPDRASLRIHHRFSIAAMDSALMER